MGALAALAGACALATGASASPAARDAGDGGWTPAARPGSDLASKRALSRSQLRARLSDAMRSAGGASGAYVYDVDAGDSRLLYSNDGRDKRIPASNQKLFTTAALLDRYGADGRLETVVHARGQTGPSGHALDGDLILVGAGDPAFGTASFASNHGLPSTPVSDLARDVRRAGIRRVNGDVRADDTVFDRRRGVGATGGRPNADLSPLSGLSFNSGYQGGRYARKPELVAARELKTALRKRGVKVTGGVGRTDTPRSILEQEPVGLVRSPPVERLIAATNKPSNNFFAEMLLKRLGAKVGRKGTTSRGAGKAERFASRVATGDKAVDGSGLGRSNRASPRQVAQLLIAMSAQPAAKAFRLSLPMAGREGTLAARMRGTAAEGRCRAKTGTVTGVSALSGYCRAGSGTVAFAILMNSVDIYAARRAQDRMAAAIARYR